MKRILVLLLVSVMVCALAACQPAAQQEETVPSKEAEDLPSAEEAQGQQPQLQEEEPQAEEQPELPPVAGDDITPVDYGDASNWSTVSEATLPVDVFVLYPTTFSPTDGSLVAEITDEGMRQGADAFVETKASAFETAGNLFAPYYRQLSATWLLTQPLSEQAQYLGGVPKTDCIAAFEYYLEHYNEGRPFILASHSQGSSMMKELLFDYLADKPDVMDRMVAAYVIGYSVTRQEMEENPHVSFAEGPNDTGVIISYNTEAPGVQEESSVWLEGSLAINPISWERGEDVAPAEDNLGSYMQQEDGSYAKVMGLADAEVDVEKGVVVCSTVDIDEYSMPEVMGDIFPKGVYHGQDIPFYYFNLRENAENRVARYLAGQ